MKQDNGNHAATPGPWLVSTDKAGMPQVISREDIAHEFIIAKTIAYKPRWLEQPNELAANARLIAASPDLLAVLELAVKYLDHPDIKAMPFAVRAETVANRAHAAITKAKRG